MVSQPQALQSTTQKYLEIYDITNDLLILQDGAASMVLNTTAINFDLFSEEEQDAVIYAYAALLNSLSFPIEIVIRSQKKDVTSYLDLLKEQEVRAYSPVNKKNIRDYREFVEQLVQERNVLDKKFYIIVTFTALEAGIGPGASFLPQVGKKEAVVLDKQTILERALTNLEPRRDHLIHQFARIGLYARQLKTQELIQLFYTIYNPDASKGARVGEPQEYSAPLIQANLPPLQPQQPLPTPIPAAQQGQPANPVVQQVPTPPVPTPPSTPLPIVSNPVVATTPVSPPSPPPIGTPGPTISSPAPAMQPSGDIFIQESPSIGSPAPESDLTPPTPPPVSGVAA